LGIQGLIGGIVIGYITSFVIGLISFPLSKLFDIGLIKKQYREAIAKDFISQYKEEILTLKRFQSMREDKIIDNFTRYINQIQDAAIKVKNPVKKHPYDLNYAEHRGNFIRGGRNWAEKFNEDDEIKLLQKYVDFCETAIYENFNKYTLE
jgi:hypothetical protein